MNKKHLTPNLFFFTIYFKKNAKILINSILFFSALANVLPIFAQGSAVSLGSDAYHIIDRLEIKTGKSVPFVTGMKPYLRRDVANYALDLDSSRMMITQQDRIDLYWLFKDNNEWLATAEAPTTLGGKRIEGKSQAEASFASDRYIERKPILKYFYNSPANAFELNQKYFYLRVNPTLNFRLGKDKYDDQLQFLNLRGIQMRGGIDDRVFFYVDIEESQARFAPYVTARFERDRAVMGAHLYKPYNSRVFKNIKNGYDYTISNGYVAFNVSRHINMQFGHSNNFIGDGYRSLILSNVSTNHLYFKINSKFGKFNYQNIFAQFSTANSEIDTLRRKYMATHLLNYKPCKNLDIAVFESIMIKPRSGDQFDYNYLNPVIFYRTVEYISGSQDNALLGFQIKYNFLKRFSAYGQFLLDELKSDQLTGQKGWWGNKYAYQVGLKYIDVFGIDHLDARVEHNFIRPYTYSHLPLTSYTNARQPLAHPLGANLKETIFTARYQPMKKLAVDARIINITTGEDSLSGRYSYGQNILKDYNNRPSDFNNFVGQGIKTNTLIAGIDLSYQFFHNMYVDFQYFYRHKNSAINSLDEKSSYFGAGLRINIANRRMDW